MTMPVMEPDLNAATLRTWAEVIDEGPFSSLCWGERVAFDNPDSLTLLGAVAAWTERVRLVTTVIVPQLHNPVALAKALATGDVLSGGRLTVGLGVGGRHEDYLAAGADRLQPFASRRDPRTPGVIGVEGHEGGAGIDQEMNLGAIDLGINVEMAVSASFQLSGGEAVADHGSAGRFDRVGGHDRRRSGSFR